MAKMKYWDGKAWVILDAKDADTLDGKHASEFANKSSFDEHITNHPKGFSGNYNDLTNKPTSMPANGGNADTVDGKHASEFAASSHGTHVSYATATTTLTSGGTGAVGTSGNVARQDHTHTLPAYPTSLPANGGNADTVDGKHASDFRPSNWMPTAADVGAVEQNANYAHFIGRGRPSTTSTNANSTIDLEVSNNRMVMGVDSEFDSRYGWIQVRHNSDSYANIYGTLALQPLGGGVTINGNYTYHTGFRPYTTGTGTPSGGSSGDVYIKYS